ncbi:MAG TPA: M48 family metalloprotease [Verrucomicrobiae bacterium]|jgi:Zn-dependent protease with chaperone function
MNWYYEENGQAAGPVSLEELTHRFHARIINARTRVRTDDDAEWRPLGEHPALAHLSPKVPPKVERAAADRVLTIQELRDSRELAALTALYVCAAPAYLLLLLWVLGGMIATHGLGLVIALAVFGMLWLMNRMMQFFALARIKTNAVRVCETQLPEVNEAVNRCVAALKIERPEVYVVQHNVWNAFAAKLAGRQIVALYTGAIDSILLTGDMAQLTWVVGHEMGHHAAGHTRWTHTLASPGAWFFWVFLWYSRRRELTCDRVGLYCVGNTAPCLLALSNLSAGAQLARKVNVEQAMNDWAACRGEFFVRYSTIYSTHPPLLWRFLHLRESAQELRID